MERISNFHISHVAGRVAHCRRYLLNRRLIFLRIGIDLQQLVYKICGRSLLLVEVNVCLFGVILTERRGAAVKDMYFYTDSYYRY